MSGPGQRKRWRQQEGEAGQLQGDQLLGADPAAADDPSAAAAAPVYIVYSSDDSLSDGELHVERRAGSITAWYQRGQGGSGQDGSPRRSPQRARSARRPSGSSVAPIDEPAEQQQRGAITVVFHDNGAAAEAEEEEEGEEEDSRQGGGAGCGAGQRAAGQAASPGGGVSWETNNLYDYLRGLQQEGPQEMDSEEWARRIGALREALRERDEEVAELHRLLEEQGHAAEGRDAELAQQAQRIAELEAHVAELEGRIRQLLAQLAAAGGGGAADAHVSFAAEHHKQRLQMAGSAAAAAAYSPAPPDSYFLQLPAQSYAEHQGCGFWQSAWQSTVESVQQHPRRWGAAAACLALFLIIVLCATLVPAANRRRARPAFVVAPTVVGAGASWLDVSVQLDRPGLVSYMAFRQADLNTPVPGLGGTLMELIQAEALQGRAVYAASAPAASLDLASASQAGLQQLAAACGWAPVASASSASRLSVLSAWGSASTACSAGTAAAPGRCARCPKLEDGTAYTLLLAAASTTGSGVGRVVVVNGVTGDSSVNVNSAEPPFADNATATSFDLHFKLNVPGTLYYAVVYDRLFAPLGASQLAFGPVTPPSAAVVSANPALFAGGLVANGSVTVAAAGEWNSVRVQPPCVGPLCSLSLWGLQAGTSYRVYLVAVDAFGTPDPAPAVVTAATAPATSAPALLPATQPANIRATGFGAAVSQEAAGAVYYLLALAKHGTAATGGEVEPGSWAQVAGLVPGGSRRRLASAAAAAAAAGSAFAAPWQRRRLLDDAGQVAPGSLVAPTCYPANRTCAAAPAAVFNSTPGLAGGFDVVASGCLPVPAAGQAVVLPAFSGLQNDTLYHLLLATEDSAVPQPFRQASPAVFAVRTVDLSSPQLACGFPLATNVTATSFSLSAMLTKPGASVFYVVLPAAAAASNPPSAADILRGTAGGGGAPAAAGNLTQWGSLPWEQAPAAGGSPDPRKRWIWVGGLQNGGNYTAFFTVTADGAVPVPGAPVAALSGILLPATVPPTFTALAGVNATVDEQRGTFALQLSAGLDRPGQVFYAMYRNYSCITGAPSIADVLAGNRLPAGACSCQDASYCALVTAGNFTVPAPGLAALAAAGGELSPLPFQSLRNATEDQLKCFQGGLGQATDTYNIYLVAASALPSFTGLAPQCSNFAQAAAVAAAAAGGAAADASCPAAPQLACSQAQLRADTQAFQAGAALAWSNGASSTTGSGATASTSLAWQPPAGAAAGRPARVQLSLEGGAPPAFTWGPAFPAGMRNGSSFGLQFMLDKPALLIYAVFRPMPIDASGAAQSPVLIATGRVPVFDAATNATTGPITACPWAPEGAMQPQSQYYVTYVARDKYGRMDGLCPGQAPGAAPRVCTDIAFTGR